MVKFPTLVQAVMVFALAEHASHAQQAVSIGAIRVTFPTAEWTETEPPPQLRDAFDGKTSPVKLIFHSISLASQLRFFITRYDYPSHDELNVSLAGYLDGVYNRCSRQAVGKVVEHIGNAGDLPVQTFVANLPGEMFIEIRTILCSDRLYSLEIGGPSAFHKEASRCLDGVSAIGETPLPRPVSEGISRVRAKTGGTTAAYERYEQSRRSGYVLGMVLTVAAVVGILVLAFKRKAPTLSPPLLSLGKVHSSPPLIPSSASPPPIKAKLEPEDRK